MFRRPGSGKLVGMTKAATTFDNIELAAEGGRAPEWVQLLPAGPRIRARDGRSWSFSPETVLAAFRANNGPLAIDYEHAQDLVAPHGQPAPAAGWVVALEDRGGAIWGQVEWTATAAQMIVERAYRFLSPAMRHTKDGVITRLAGAGLVNRPALEMTALSREQETEPMNFKAIAQALGLAETADETAILAALAERDGERSALCAELGIDAGSTAIAITAGVKKLKTDAETALAAVQAAPNAEEMAEMRTSLASLRKERQDEKITAALDAAQAAGKITPASRADYLAMCSVEGGLERFENLVKTLTPIAAPSKLGAAPTVADATEENPVALAARARKYQDEQAAFGIIVSISDAVHAVKEAK